MYTLVLGSLFPEYLPYLVSYQLTIVKLSKRFRYPSWPFYDVEFRKWAATNGIKDWSKSNSELFALAFTGQAASTWCPICQVEGDHTYDCPGTSFPEQVQRKAIPSLMQPPPKRPAPPHCILYNNAGACPYGLACKYRHVCTSCANPHPVSSCPHKPSRQTCAPSLTRSSTQYSYPIYQSLIDSSSYLCTHITIITITYTWLCHVITPHC